MSAAIPLAEVANAWLGDLVRATGAAALAGIDGATLLGERAMLGAFRIPGLVSAGGGCRLYESRTELVALNLARADDRDLLPALFETEIGDDVAALIAERDARDLVARGRLLGMAIAVENERAPLASSLMTVAPFRPRPARAPRVLDLSALWAGPLAAHLLWLAGAEVTKVESRTRPDAMRNGDTTFFALLNQGKASVELDFRSTDGLIDLLALIARADIVIEAARPRALLQLGVDADAIVRAMPGLTWVTITGHGTTGGAADWVGFGDDCGVAGGLTAALRAASGRVGFVGDAIADPLTGLRAAGVAWHGWASGKGGRFGLAMSGVVAEALAEARAAAAAALDRALIAWAAAAGSPFAPVARRAIERTAARGADTRACLARC